MRRGRIVEHGTVTDIFDNPQRPSLLETIPSGVAYIVRVPYPRPADHNEEETA
jgi:peptide/nickel transport system ATP-binding protein